MAGWATRWNPLIFLYAPLAAHVLGGQTALVALLGVALYARYPNRRWTGVALAISSLKPQLFIIPASWALCEWIRARQYKPLLAFGGTLLAIYLPTLLLIPDWPRQWLSNPRDIAERALAGIVPRTLLILTQTPNLLFWVGLVGIAGILAWTLRKRLDFRLWVILGCVLSPLVHDYDLIMLLPVLDGALLVTAVLAAAPEWIVILAFYADDHAWFAVTLIPLVLLGAVLMPSATMQKYLTGPRRSLRTARAIVRQLPSSTLLWHRGHRPAAPDNPASPE